MSDRIPTGASDSVSDPVRLTIPAVPAALPIARIVATAVGAQANLTIDDIDDLTIAVEEALIALLDHGAESLHIAYSADPERVAVDASSDGRSESWPPSTVTEGLGWKVLTGLTDEVEASTIDGVPHLVFTKLSSIRV